MFTYLLIGSSLAAVGAMLIFIEEKRILMLMHQGYNGSKVKKAMFLK
jgi:hypothetical protein